MDRNGGSNPLTLVVAEADGRALNHKDAYKDLWTLQTALEEHKGVGTVVSLPLLVAEGRRRPLSFLVSTEHILKTLDEPKYGRVARTFITPDRMQAAFYLRMVERDRTRPRAEVVDNLRAVVRRSGFKTVLAGGIYRLEGDLAALVASSVTTGLLWLMLLFTIIAVIVARSIRGAAAMIVSLSLVPLCMLGGVGLLRVPVDIISAPATNICIGMAIDSMVHLMFGVRRAERDGGRRFAAEPGDKFLGQSDRVLRCDYRRRFRDLRALGLSTDTTLRVGRRVWHDYRYPRQSVRSAIAWRRQLEAIAHSHVTRAQVTISYSVRKASRGLRRAPRRAGSQHATSATVNNRTVVAANTTGSRALTP